MGQTQNKNIFIILVLYLSKGGDNMVKNDNSVISKGNMGKSAILLIVLLIVFLAIAVLLMGPGCNKQAAAGSGGSGQSNGQSAGDSGQAAGQQEQSSGTPGGAISGTSSQGQKCNYLYEPQDVKKIDLSMLKEGRLEKTADGFSFGVIPQTENGSIVAADGFVTVKIYTTKFNLGNRVTDYEVYRNSFRINDENVAGDCSSEKITVKFADIQASQTYKFVKEGDPGIMFVEFSVTGSRTVFDNKYEPEKQGASLFR